MTRRLRPITLALLAIGSIAVQSHAATAQKGVLGTGANPTTGIVDPTDGSRYTALGAGAGTMVAKLTSDGRLERYRYVDRHLVVPSVAYDGSPGGLSADGQTLVLSEPGTRFPQRSSGFTVLDTRRLGVIETLEFEGTFTYDAISPDGRSLYLIEYTSPRDLTEYRVREYDLRRGEFNPDPIIDPNESGEDMYGSPVTRTTSPDGRWAYTLYDGREHPFIHALDTERGTAVCIDLESLHRIVYGSTGLEPNADGSALTVVNGAKPVEIVDTRTFEVAPAPAPDETASATGEPGASPVADDGSDSLAWVALGGGLGLLALLGALVVVRRRRRRPLAEAELERLVATDRAGDAPELERERDPVR